MTELRPYPADWDVYGKDASKATSGKDMIFRFHRRENGVVYLVTCLSPEEAKAYREEHSFRPKKRK